MPSVSVSDFLGAAVYFSPTPARPAAPRTNSFGPRTRTQLPPLTGAAIQRGEGRTPINKKENNMTRKLWGVTPTQSHNLAGRVVSMFRKSGLAHRLTLNRIHEIVETRSYDPWGLKLFLKNVVDLYTAPAPMPPATREQRVQYEKDRNAVLGGEQIVGMYEFDASPATDLGEHFSLPAYETEPDTYEHEEDE